MASMLFKHLIQLHSPILSALNSNSNWSLIIDKWAKSEVNKTMSALARLSLSIEILFRSCIQGVGKSRKICISDWTKQKSFAILASSASHRINWGSLAGVFFVVAVFVSTMKILVKLG